MHRGFLAILVLVNMSVAGVQCSRPASPSPAVSPEKRELFVQPGQRGALLIRVEVPKGSHIYGNPKGPGTGMPTTVTPPRGRMFAFELPRFLPPRKYVQPGEKAHVWIYERETRIALPFAVSAHASPGRYPVRAEFSALLCTTRSCQPWRADLDFVVEVVQPGHSHDALYDNVLEAFTVESGRESDAGIAKDFGESPPRGLKGEAFRPRYITRFSVSSVIKALLFGILAGFILNFMPCVLPVVSLKVMSFVRHAREERARIFRLGVIFSAGILTSFLFLAALAAFMGYHWGQLFQNPLFIVTMIAIVFSLALSMLGVYSFNVPSFALFASRDRENPYADTYMKGLLATLLATPCSGPFLGGTLAFAMTQKPAMIFLVFMSIGFGMALPYLILAARPGLLRYIPKPGEWMITFEHLMAFLLVATAVYLLGVLKDNLILPTLWFMIFLSIALWQYGRFGAPGQPRRRRILSAGIMAAITLLGAWLSFSVLAPRQEKSTLSPSRELTMNALLHNRDAGVISMVKFTADWCPNCKLVESTSLYTRRVMREVAKRRVQFFIGDLTRENPEAQDLLQRLGSHSIPFLAVFPPAGSFYEPLCLRDMYSEQDVLGAIKAAHRTIPRVNADTIRFLTP